MTSKVCRSVAQATSLAAACFFVACAGPERAPRQPIPGVDTPDVKVTNPHDQTGPGAPAEPPRQPPPTAVADPVPEVTPPAVNPPAPSVPSNPPATKAGGLLDGFVQKVAAEVKGAPGIVAVFPAMAQSGEGNQRGYSINGLGEWLMEETAAGLEREGVRGILAGGSLTNDIKASNRGLDAWRAPDDTYWLADRIGAGYVVQGIAQVKVFDAARRDEAVELLWECRRLPDRSVVATMREEVARGPLAAQLYRRARTDSAWRIGNEAPVFRPVLDAELRILAGLLAQRVADKQGKLLAGKSVRVFPSVFRCNAGEGAALQAAADELERAYTNLLRKATAAAEGGDAEAAALESGPVTIAGKKHDSLGAAIDAFGAAFEAYKASPIGGLAVDLSRLVTERLRAATGDSFRVLADDGDRRRLLAIIRSEARSYRRDAAVDADTIAQMRAKGTDVVLETVLRPTLKTYQLRLVLRDLRTAQEITEAIDVDGLFQAELDQMLGK
jgi:hypothetical protein